MVVFSKSYTFIFLIYTSQYYVKETWSIGYSIQAGKKLSVFSQKPMSLCYIEIHEWAEMLEN